MHGGVGWEGLSLVELLARVVSVVEEQLAWGKLCSITSQPLLGYSELHVWLVGFSCNRSAPEAAALSMQVSSSLHIVFMLQ